MENTIVSYLIQKDEPLKFLIYFAISKTSILNYSIARQLTISDSGQLA
jgi:hypothetical protein